MEEAIVHLAALIGRGLPAEEAARTLVRGFGSLADVLAAHRSRRTTGMVDGGILFRLDEIGAAIGHLLGTRITRLPLLATVEELLDYLRVDMGYDGRERMRVLFLDARGQLIVDEVVCEGTIDQALVDPRTIVFRGLQLEASKLLLVHNHPSGSPEPSQGDIAITRTIHRLTSSMGMPVVDHIIATRGGCASMRQLGLLKD